MTTKEIQIDIQNTILKLLKEKTYPAPSLIKKVTKLFLVDEFLVRQIVWKLSAAGDIEFSPGFKKLSLRGKS